MLTDGVQASGTHWPLAWVPRGAGGQHQLQGTQEILKACVQQEGEEESLNEGNGDTPQAAPSRLPRRHNHSSTGSVPR